MPRSPRRCTRSRRRCPSPFRRVAFAQQPPAPDQICAECIACRSTRSSERKRNEKRADWSVAGPPPRVATVVLKQAPRGRGVRIAPQGAAWHTGSHRRHRAHQRNALTAQKRAADPKAGLREPPEAGDGQWQQAGHTAACRTSQANASADQHRPMTMASRRRPPDPGSLRCRPRCCGCIGHEPDIVAPIQSLLTLRKYAQ